MIKRYENLIKIKNEVNKNRRENQEKLIAKED